MVALDLSLRKLPKTSICDLVASSRRRAVQNCAVNRGGWYLTQPTALYASHPSQHKARDKVQHLSGLLPTSDTAALYTQAANAGHRQQSAVLLEQDESGRPTSCWRRIIWLCVEESGAVPQHRNQK
ncbi:unnamed protein product [Ectocarpus sp. 4 AP-2014]